MKANELYEATLAAIKLQRNTDDVYINSVPVGSKWKHRNRHMGYEVITHTNTASMNPKYPPTVVYKGDNGFLWSRPLNDWHRSMELCSHPVDVLSYYDTVQKCNNPFAAICSELQLEEYCKRMNIDPVYIIEWQLDEVKKDEP